MKNCHVVAVCSSNFAIGITNKVQRRHLLHAPYAPQTCPVMPCYKKIAVFVPKLYFLFARTGKKQYLCAVENTTAFIDACLGILKSGRFRANRTRIDRCFRGMYPLCPLGMHTYPRGLLSFILVAGSCRNLKIVNKQG